VDETGTKYHHRDGDSENPRHYAGEHCTTCHPHFTDEMDNYFEPTLIGPQSHDTHLTDFKGPQFEVQYGEDACIQCHKAGDFEFFTDDLPKATTGVCDNCHSPGLPFDGVVPAKAQWTDGVYQANGSDLNDGNENWCASCHDEGTSIVNGVAAPNVMGNNSTYGYNISGHGKGGEPCYSCHDYAATEDSLHTDGEPRTYEAASDNYKDGYRLKADMAVPRTNDDDAPGAFSPCTNCHIWTDLIGPNSNFRQQGSGTNYENWHNEHLNNWEMPCSDSDFDGAQDSGVTCIICHNVHGPPNGAMVRHGELIDKVPALAFLWLKEDGTTVTYTLEDSLYGALKCGVEPDISINHVCWGCHTPEQQDYLIWYRNPRGITLESVWTTNLSGLTKRYFLPNEDVRYNARFTIDLDPDTYLVKIALSGAGNNAAMLGTDWFTPLSVQGTTTPGTYTVFWNRKIPGEADVGSEAKLLIQIGVFEADGDPLLDQDKMIWNFNIGSQP
jgi:hypothetical protein